MSEDETLVLIIDNDAFVRESLRNLISSVGLNAQTFASAEEFLACPGAVEFLTKPVRAEELLLDAVEPPMNRAREIDRSKSNLLGGGEDFDGWSRQVASRAKRLDSRAASRAAEPDLEFGLGRAIGESAEWRDVLKKAERVASTDATVLLQGESGTGKEVVARLIHRASARKDGSFLAINCAALPEELLESELFGYERGAFTGALKPKPGRIELASGGVLFLDEVSELSARAQAKLLRVLQEREFQRLGATRPLKANVRVIAATNRDLLKAVEQGTFREDLYYRLQVFEIRIPPLRDRKSDIPLLARAFLQEISRSVGRPLAGLSDAAKAALLAHDWPGNVRELRNALERAAILSDGGLITTEELSLHSPQSATAPNTTSLRTVERQMIEQVLRETRWNKSMAAKRLGISRTQLYVRLRKYGIEKSLNSP